MALRGPPQQQRYVGITPIYVPQKQSLDDRQSILRRQSLGRRGELCADRNVGIGPRLFSQLTCDAWRDVLFVAQQSDAPFAHRCAAMAERPGGEACVESAAHVKSPQRL